jgi:predicted KAP-like P-loop ATPase
MGQDRQLSEVHPELLALQDRVKTLKARVNVAKSDLNILKRELEAAIHETVEIYKKTKYQKEKDGINPTTASELVEARKAQSQIQNLVGKASELHSRTQTALTAAESALVTAQKELTRGIEKNVTETYRPPRR